MTDILVRRGMILEDAARRAIHDLNVADKSHLGSALEHQIVLIEALIADLHQNAVLSDHHRHTIEEMLLNLENRVSEELIAIQMAIHHQHEGNSVEWLIKKAEDLISKAQGVMRHAPAGDRDLEAAKHEVKALGELITKLRALGTQAKDTSKEEAQLVRIAQSLEHILARLARHVKPDPGSHHSGTASPHGHF